MQDDVCSSKENIKIQTISNEMEKKDEADENNRKPVQLQREFGLFALVCYIVGCMIGSGIFITPASVLTSSGSPGMCLMVWIGCGIITMISALAFAELGTIVQRSGSTYAYYIESFSKLHPYFGPLPAFLYAWILCVIFLPAGCAVLILTLSEHLCKIPSLIYDINIEDLQTYITMVSIFVLVLITIINILSVKAFVKIQELFSCFKVFVCLSIVVGGIYAALTGRSTNNLSIMFDGSTTKMYELALAFYSAQWCYDGAAAVTEITEEVKNPSKDIPRSILIAVPLVMFLYVTMNVSFMTVLTLDEMKENTTTAVIFGEKLLKSFSIIIPTCIAILSFQNALGSQFGSTRLCYVAGQEGHMIKLLSYLNVHWFTPIPAILFQAVMILLCILFGNIKLIIEFAGFLVSIFNGGAMVSLIVLRRTKPDVYRPYKVPLIIPYFLIIFYIAVVLFPIIGDPTINYVIGLGFILSGIIVYTLFVYYKLKLPCMRKVTKSVQVLFQVEPSLSQAKNSVH